MSTEATVCLTESDLLLLFQGLDAETLITLCQSNPKLQLLCDDPTSVVGQLVLDKILEERERIERQLKMPTQKGLRSRPSRSRPSRQRTPKHRKDPDLQKVWDLIGQALRERSIDLEAFRGKTVIIIDLLNKSFGKALKDFNYHIGTEVERGGEYIGPSSAVISYEDVITPDNVYYGGSCRHTDFERSTTREGKLWKRDLCQSQVGIQRLRFEDPIAYDVEFVREEEIHEVYYKLAEQVPKVVFILVERTELNPDEVLRFESLPSIPNILRVLTNSKINKEIDDLTVVSLYFRLRTLRADTYINTCDKYRWMKKILPTAQEASVKRNQVTAYFLSPDVFDDEPALILMGYECAYDCGPEQESPFVIDQKSCKLKPITRRGLDQPRYI